MTNTLKYKLETDERPIKPATNILQPEKDSQNLIHSFGTTITPKDQTKPTSQTYNYEVNAHKVSINIMQNSTSAIICQPLSNRNDHEVMVNTPMLKNKSPKKKHLRSKPEINSK